MVELGLGLIGIGREWGFRRSAVPSEPDAIRFLEEAVGAGIRFLDTAPSYGWSEERLGKFLKACPGLRPSLTVATKAGEHWDEATDTLHVDHSYDALARSIDRSLTLLGRIDLLQVHKATAANLQDPEVRRALDHARAAGAAQLGASVTDLEAAEIVMADDTFQAIQIPFHLNNRKLEPVFGMAATRGKRVLVNRPFGMGELLYEPHIDPHTRRVEAFKAIIDRTPDAVILTGTRSTGHLHENLEAFRSARR